MLSSQGLKDHPRVLRAFTGSSRQVQGVVDSTHNSVTLL
jgi:hypothetical protein